MFDEMPMINVASWNLMISEYANPRSGEREVWKLVKEMQAEGMKPVAFTICTVLPLCWTGVRGREIHCYVVRRNLGLDLDFHDFHVRSCLISTYSKGKGLILEGRFVIGWHSRTWLHGQRRLMGSLRKLRIFSE